MILKCPCHKLKKCAARIILDAAPDVPSQLLFNELNWLNIYERIEYNEGIPMFKILHGLVPSYLRNLVTFQTSNNYQFRSISNGKHLLRYWPILARSSILHFAGAVNTRQKITVHIINLVYSEFPNRSRRSVRSFISTLDCT